MSTLKKCLVSFTCHVDRGLHEIISWYITEYNIIYIFFTKKKNKLSKIHAHKAYVFKNQKFIFGIEQKHRTSEIRVKNTLQQVKSHSLALLSVLTRLVMCKGARVIGLNPSPRIDPIKDGHGHVSKKHYSVRAFT